MTTKASETTKTIFSIGAVDLKINLEEEAPDFMAATKISFEMVEDRRGDEGLAFLHNFEAGDKALLTALLTVLEPFMNSRGLPFYISNIEEEETYEG